jgi:nucleoside-diphosphate-sugar epimerase
LVAALADAGHHVSCLVRPTAATDAVERLGTRLIPGDICHLESVRAASTNVDVVYHLAGRVAAFSYRDFAAVNVAGCDHVARACASQPSPPKLVIVSSLAAGGPSSRERPRSEEDDDAPVSHYGRSKLVGEEAALRYGGDLPLLIVRPPFVFGPDDVGSLAMLRPIHRTGWHFVPGRRDLPLSLIHVDDLVKALLLMGERDARRPLKASATESPIGSRKHLYYIAHPQATTYSELGLLAASAMNRRVRVLRVRKGWMILPALWGELAWRAVRVPRV